MVVGLWLLLATTACDRLPQLGPDASVLRPGDSLEVVEGVLDEHAAEYRTRSEIEASRFGYFTFTNLTSPSTPETDASGLPEVAGRALWYPFFKTAGNLVYLDPDDRVVAVFFAGT